jgi:Tfp pilus assembly protein PilF
MFLENENLDQAKQYLERALQLNSSCDTAYFALGYYYKNSGDIVHAIEHFKKAHELNPQLRIALEEYNLLSARIKK